MNMTQNALSRHFYPDKLYPLLAPDWPPQKPPKKKQPIPPSILLVPNETPLIEPWIYETRAVPECYALPDNVIQRIAMFCIDPRDLLRFSSTCRKFGILLRNVVCWLDHHWGRGFDIGILEIKAKCAAARADQKYGSTGWGFLVKSACDKWEFPDDTYQTQIAQGTPLPHIMMEDKWTVAGKVGESPVDAYQDRGVYWMRVMYDLVTENEGRNFILYPYLHDEALSIRVHDKQSRFLQALITAAHLMIGQWQAPYGELMTGIKENYLVSQSIRELGTFDKTRSTKTSLTHSLLCAIKMMLCDEFQKNRRMYPHPPLGPAIWVDDKGEIPPSGLGWLAQIKRIWRGHIKVIGEFTSIVNRTCEYARPKLSKGTMRMKLEFHPNNIITGTGTDFGGNFHITGSYQGTAVSLIKTYPEDENEDTSEYFATGQMLPWGIYGDWREKHPEDNPFHPVHRDDPPVQGYWGMWIFEGANPIPCPFTCPYGENLLVIVPKPYTPDLDWYEKFEELVPGQSTFRRLVLPKDSEISFSDIESEYEDEEIDGEGNVVKPKKKKPKVKQWFL